jgi:hypothetical protein
VRPADYYASFVQEFERWHHRITPEGSERFDACSILSMLQVLNLMALSLWAPQFNVSRWMFVLIFFGCFFVLQFLNGRVFDKTQTPMTYAAWTDRVPGIAEFPRVYGYFLLTIALFFAPIFAR